MTRRKVLLVGWDAADWKILNPLLERAAMPAFGSLAAGGTIADMTTLQPVLSPMLWTSIATGKRADRHGILGFTEVDPVTRRVRPVTNLSRHTKAIWNILGQNGIRTNVVGWFGGHPAEPVRGVCVSDAYARGMPAGEGAWPLMSGTVFPVSIASELEKLRLTPNEIDGEILRLFVPQIDAIDLSRPNLLGMLSRVLAESFTTHAAATWVMENSEWDFMAVYYIGIDHFSHGFMNFHPPRLDWIGETEFELYRNVIESAYRLMDLFLGRLLHLAGPETTVLVMSDHGFHSDRLRPRNIPRIPAGPASQHRPLGIFTMAGAGIRAKEKIHGVNLLDVVPTLLALFGLPAAEDMPGRVLSEAFEAPVPLHRISSWDAVPGDAGQHPEGLVLPPGDYDALIDQFVALGYVEAQPPELERAVAECERETQWNLARVFTSSWRFSEALPLLEQLHAESPARADFALALADCQLRVGLLDEAAASAADALAANRESAVGRYVLGRIACERRNFAEGLEHFRVAEARGRHLPELCANLGFSYIRLRLWSDAERAFTLSLSVDPHNALAHQGLARVRLRQQRFGEAAESALTSIGYRHDLPLSHFALGAALMQLGRRATAIQAFETSLTFPPPLPVSHRMLAKLYGSSPQGLFHRRAAAEALQARRSDHRNLDALKQEARHRAIDRAERQIGKASAGDTHAGFLPGAKDFIVVSGLPRSGTSLMMKLLAAGGLPVMTDGERAADDDNPEGYFEWEAIRLVAARPEILDEAEGKVIKVISMLLPSLPAHHRYRVIFMDRPIEEIAASQNRMTRRRGTGVAGLDSARLEQVLRSHRDDTVAGLRNAKDFKVLMVDYPSLVRDPGAWLPRIVSFVGGMETPDAMAGVIRPDLYRNRT